MSFSIGKKKKYKFAVRLRLEGLSSVPYINGRLFAKVRLIDGGSFCQESEREEVNDHCVKWDRKFEFECRMSANASNGVLSSCLIRISVRREVNGGRTSQKLGFVDLDLAEFAGAGLTCKRCLLEAYSNTHHRSDNSSLKMWIEMTLLSGDPLFKRPTRGNSSFYAPLPDMDELGAKGVTSDMDLDPLSQSQTSQHLLLLPSDPSMTESLAPGVNQPQQQQQPLLLSNSSTKDSLTENQGSIVLEDSNSHQTHSPYHPTTGSLSLAMLTGGSNGTGVGLSGSVSGMMGLPAVPPSTPSSRRGDQSAITNTTTTETMGHSRNSSQQSKASVGYGSLPAHSRQGSTEAAAAMDGGQCVTVVTAPVTVTATAGGNGGNRVDQTRINPDDVIQELVAINLATQPEVEEEENPDDVGLEIYVSKDGTATLGSRSGTNDRSRVRKKQQPSSHHPPTATPAAAGSTASSKLVQSVK